VPPFLVDYRNAVIMSRLLEIKGEASRSPHDRERSCFSRMQQSDALLARRPVLASIAERLANPLGNLLYR
jgi:hypothetical protein